MPVSKRLRFEVLRRDNHTCQLCGGTAPDVVLTVDHVVPVALGGGDAPENLQAACKDCNAGKSSVPAGAPMVAGVANDARRWADAMRAAADKAAADRLDQEAMADRFANVWDSYTFTSMGYGASIPDDWTYTIDRLIAAGLTIEDLLEFANRALSNSRINRWSKFKYFCGIAWGTLTDRQEAARAALVTPTVWMSPLSEAEQDYAELVYERLSILTDGRALAEMGAI